MKSPSLFFKSALAVGILLGCPVLFGQAGPGNAGDQVEMLAPRESAPRSNAEFYELQTTIEELRRQMDQLRLDVEAYRAREMTPEVYENILRRLTPPPMTHEVVLTNGTVVRGNIIDENIDQVTLETSLGTLTLDKEDVRSINQITNVNPNLQFLGDANEEIYDTYRIYTGAVRNNGISRGDFVRIVFKLWNAQTELVASDSAFIDGSRRIYLSGVTSDTALEPGAEGDYRVRVNIARDAGISYMTREIHWERLE